jgi:uncharacterized protein YecT (DUF1311 family)
MRSRTGVVGLALLVMSHPASSEEFNRGQFERYCEGDPATGQQVIRCLEGQKRKAGEMLTAKYRKIAAGLNRREIDTLKESQQAWLAYQKTSCRFLAMRVGQVENTDVSQVEQARCLLKSTLDRMEELDGLLLSDR